jgi:TatD DNase family protein
MALTDTHCHLDLERFDSDRKEVIRRAIEAGLTRILVPGLSVPSSRVVVELAATHAMLYAAVGVHPTEARTWGESTRKELCTILRPSETLETFIPSKIVAIGEIGLDYYWDTAPHDLQRKILAEQLDLADEVSLPVILHLREAKDATHGPCSDDLLELLGKWVTRLKAMKSPLAERPGVLHSFSGDLETARVAIEFGFFIGVTGPVTYRQERQELIRQLPLERLLIETDSPFLAPYPQRGKRNEPSYVRLIADKIASLHVCSFEEVAARTSENALKLFLWKDTT